MKPEPEAGMRSPKAVGRRGGQSEGVGCAGDPEPGNKKSEWEALDLGMRVIILRVRRHTGKLLESWVMKYSVTVPLCLCIQWKSWNNVLWGSDLCTLRGSEEQGGWGWVAMHR